MSARAPADNIRAERHWPMLVFFVGLMYAAGALGGAVTFPEIDGWYAGIAKPAWTPPNGIFTPVWNTIFALTGIATWMVWRRVGSRGDWVSLFVVQWTLNVCWSFAFFGLHSPGAALVVIAALWLSLAALIAVYWKVRALAGAMLLPYIAWVSFATALNLAIWRLN
jgi:translocator protein